jgi:hypothetical protein
MDQHEQDTRYEAPVIEDLDTTEAPSSVAAGAVTPPPPQN